jgi:hypothetical protein
MDKLSGLPKQYYISQQRHFRTGADRPSPRFVIVRLYAIGIAQADVDSLEKNALMHHSVRANDGSL